MELPSDIQNGFKTLENVLKEECARGEVYYFANPGNQGDGLIRAGTVRFFEDIGLDYKELRGAKKRRWALPYLNGGTLIYGGGGAWCDRWTCGRDVVSKLHRRFKIIVLPSTYEQCFSIPNTLFFCRDRFESKKNMPSATFCHDMAFYLGKQELPASNGCGKGYFFRTDVFKIRN